MLGSVEMWKVTRCLRGGFWRQTKRRYWDLVAKTYCDSAKKLEHVFHEQLKLTDCDALLQVMLRTKDLIRPFIDQMKLDLKRNGGPLPGTLMHGDFRSDNLFFPDDHCVSAHTYT